MCKQIYYIFSTINLIFLTLLFNLQYVIAWIDGENKPKFENYSMKRGKMLIYTITKWEWTKYIYFHKKPVFANTAKTGFILLCRRSKYVYNLFFSYFTIDNASILQVLTLYHKTFCIDINSLTSKIVIFSLNYLSRVGNECFNVTQWTNFRHCYNRNIRYRN